jgi:hypothetical protein
MQLHLCCPDVPSWRGPAQHYLSYIVICCTINVTSQNAYSKMVTLFRRQCCRDNRKLWGHTRGSLSNRVLQKTLWVKLSSVRDDYWIPNLSIQWLLEKPAATSANCGVFNSAQRQRRIWRSRFAFCWTRLIAVCYAVRKNRMNCWFT